MYEVKIYRDLCSVHGIKNSHLPVDLNLYMFLSIQQLANQLIPIPFFFKSKLCVCMYAFICYSIDVLADNLIVTICGAKVD